MPRAERLEVVKVLREEGHSVRAIAGAVGAPPSTVQGDLAAVRARTPEAARGLDGKTPCSHEQGVGERREGYTRDIVANAIGMSGTHTWPGRGASKWGEPEPTWKTPACPDAPPGMAPRLRSGALWRAWPAP